MKDYFGGTVKAGVLTFDEPLRWRATLGRHVGRRVTVIIRREQLRRTTQANAWYWACVVPLFSEWTGYEKDEAHEVLKQMFLKVEKVLPTGEIVESTGRTSTMNIEEFSEYCNRIVRFLAEHGIAVPEPGQRAEATL